MNINNRLKKIENTKRINETCCDSPYLKVEPDADNRKCRNCGNDLVIPPNPSKYEIELIKPRI